MNKIKPIRSEADYEAALAEVERLWGASSGTPEGDRLDVLATLIDAYESEHHPMDLPDPIEAIKFRMEQKASPARIWRESLAAAPALPKCSPPPRSIDRHDPPAIRKTRHFGRGADPPISRRCSP
jgi:HTH-type transcriptional regulator/antitoxin HigA